MRAARTRQTLVTEWAASWVKCTSRTSHYRHYSHTFLWASASSCDFFNFINFSPLFLFIWCVCLTRVLPQHNAKLFLFFSSWAALDCGVVILAFLADPQKKKNSREKVELSFYFLGACIFTYIFLRFREGICVGCVLILRHGWYCDTF